MRRLRKAIESLETFPYMYATRKNQLLQQYGLEVRRMNYKQTAIIYTIYGDIVFIHRIIAGNMINELH